MQPGPHGSFLHGDTRKKKQHKSRQSKTNTGVMRKVCLILDSPARRASGVISASALIVAVYILTLPRPISHQCGSEASGERFRFRLAAAEGHAFKFQQTTTTSLRHVAASWGRHETEINDERFTRRWLGAVRCLITVRFATCRPGSFIRRQGSAFAVALSSPLCSTDISARE